MTLYKIYMSCRSMELNRCCREYQDFWQNSVWFRKAKAQLASGKVFWVFAKLLRWSSWYPKEILMSRTTSGLESLKTPSVCSVITGGSCNSGSSYSDPFIKTASENRAEIKLSLSFIKMWFPWLRKYCRDFHVLENTVINFSELIFHRIVWVKS